MAKAPKAPGLNGPKEPEVLLDEFVTCATSPRFQNDRWGAQVLVGAVGAVAGLFGDEVARRWTSPLARQEGLAAVALGRVGEGLARRGDGEAAGRVLAEAEERIRSDRLDGERGTLAWVEVARGRLARGEDAAAERAFDKAEACIACERSNTSLAWAHFARGLAAAGRLGRLVGFLRFTADASRGPSGCTRRAAPRCSTPSPRRTPRGSWRCRALIGPSSAGPWVSR